VSRGYAWGIDCGSLRVGLGLVDMDTGEIESSAVAWRERAMQPAQSLMLAHAHLHSAFLIARVNFPPATIAFELPTGKHRNPSLVMHTGVIVLAAAQATGLHPWKAGVTEWKKIVQGHGQAAKDSLIPWCASLGHVTDDVDRAAGVAIAAFAASTVGGLDLGLLHGAETDRRAA
jgi:Holliday junction resolvasome RuvABC endonuclease subunit